MMRLLHRLFISGDVLDPDGPASLGGGAGGTARDEDGEPDGVVVCGASGP
jgi:hypothetical protein